MKARFLIGISLLLIISNLSGQKSDSATFNKKSNSIRIEFGSNQIKELNLIPLVHRGSLTGFSFLTEKNGKQLNRFEVSVVYSRLKTQYEELAKSGNIKLNICYSKSWLLIQNGNLKYYLGPHASLLYSFMLYPNWDDSHAYWADCLSIGPENIVSVTFSNNQEWFSSLNIPVFTLYGRPDEQRLFKMDNSSAGGMLNALNSDIRPGFWNRAFQLNFNTEYRFPIFNNKREAISYSLNISRITRKRERPVIQSINQVGIKFMF